MVPKVFEPLKFDCICFLSNPFSVFDFCILQSANVLQYAYFLQYVELSVMSSFSSDYSPSTVNAFYSPVHNQIGKYLFV